MSAGAARAPEIGPVCAGETRDVGELLARAFCDNPLNVAVIGSDDPVRRLRACRPGTRDLVEAARQYGDAWAAWLDGVPLAGLIAAPPGGHPLPPPPLYRRLLTLWVHGWHAARRWVDAFETLQRYHPLEPHWYLGTLGVDPPQQARGVGTALLRHWLRRVDGDRASVYLETDRERNVSWYQREGFSVGCRVQVLGVPVWCMQRPPMGSPAERRLPPS